MSRRRDILQQASAPAVAAVASSWSRPLLAAEPGERRSLNRKAVVMGKVNAGGTALQVETFGDRGKPPMVLIMGFGAQLTRWPVEFCGLLADAGFFVVRFDNRDVGLSQRFPAQPYRLLAMAKDVVALLDSLGLQRAHLVGASMGAMIAQLVAAGYPDRVLSLASIMSPSANPEIPMESGALKDRPAEFMGALEPEALIAHEVAYRRKLRAGNDGGSTDLEAEVRSDFARSFDPGGVMRQGAAMGGYHDRRQALGNVRVPTVVIQGDADPIVPAEAARDIASQVAGSSLVIVQGMGHDLTRMTWPRVTAAIISNARKADQSGKA